MVVYVGLSVSRRFVCPQLSKVKVNILGLCLGWYGHFMALYKKQTHKRLIIMNIKMLLNYPEHKIINSHWQF